jgi:hypothetical protein
MGHMVDYHKELQRVVGFRELSNAIQHLQQVEIELMEAASFLRDYLVDDDTAQLVEDLTHNAAAIRYQILDINEKIKKEGH